MWVHAKGPHPKPTGSGWKALSLEVLVSVFDYHQVAPVSAAWRLVQVIKAGESAYEKTGSAMQC